MSNYDGWPPYVSVAQRRAQAQREMKKRQKKGIDVYPVDIKGRKITRTFWGDAWCKHLENFSDYANRLPRGQRYVRNGSVCHLGIEQGALTAIVSGSELYDINISIKPLEKNRWQAIQKHCSGQIGSLLELLQGKLSDSVMAVVTDPKTGLFPQPNDITLNCNCPDWASLCKHLAAVLYGVGARLDKQPELLFTLRGVDHNSLISTEFAIPTGTGKRRRLSSDIGDVFGIELDNNTNDVIDKKSPTQAKPRQPEQKKPFNPSSATVSRLRKRLGINRAQFAQLIGVSSSTIALWENQGGRLALREQSKQALAAVVDIKKPVAWKRLGLKTP